MKDLGVLPGGSYSHAYDINDLGEVTGMSIGSNKARGFVYSNDQMRDLNNLIYSELGVTLEPAAINNKGQITGYTAGNAIILNPLTFTSTPEDGVTIGNISTSGDSVLLKGSKINLTGTKVATKGGSVTLIHHLVWLLANNSQVPLNFNTRRVTKEG